MPPPIWPKVLPSLSPEQKRINDAFMQGWHAELTTRKLYQPIEDFNHNFPVRHSRAGFRTTLEIGAGLGAHLGYEILTPEQRANYYCNDLRVNMAEAITRQHPDVRTAVADCQQPFDFPDNFFDRYIAVHVFEHLPNLPGAIREAWRLLHKERGQLLLVIPCEGGAAYALARRLSAQRAFERTYRMPYEVFIKREHLNMPREILAELDPYFILEERIFFPLPFLPFVFPNLVIGLSLVPRPIPACPTPPP
ncbi:MAG: methyltransferase [Lacunisphaera sp.]|nr:methyltransferase [Lacunisphaera sp.]